ncbi:MAG TPA: lysophospholipid acyltransferase family protein [Candidatus Avacidaminococcus intestinavium]|uniref:Lysophospholipid acyltransferase family protein n=1 Tax=Candidatus Avacidaminococcus intestinavium TaxID=2840684 RepID=A0A9D1MPM9_9FIRM|nr:lysophospholipid acyltransferase family protein [Candidatus Avacidaminococcus intestinavium]
MLYYLLRTLSFIISHLPYRVVVRIGKVLGRLYWHVAKKQRIRAEATMTKRLGVSEAETKKHIKQLFIKTGITFVEILYMPALNKDNIRGLVVYDRIEMLWEELAKGKGAVMLACHMDNWEWLGASLALYGFPISAVEKPQPNRVYSDFLNKLRKGAGQEIFSRGTSEILGCARALKKGRFLGLIADQDGGKNGIFAPFFGKMAATPAGPAYFARKFKVPVIPIFIVRNENYFGHRAIVKDPIYYDDTGNRESDDYNITLKMNQEIEAIIREYPDNWLWFQHRWNTPYIPPEGGERASAEK